MIIDFHTHTFPDHIAGRTIHKLSHTSHVPPYSDGTAGGLSAAAQGAGVDLAVVLPVATSPKQVVHINDYAAQTNGHTAETGLFSFGGIHPDYPEWKEELARIAELGLKGIKLHPVYQDVDVDDPRTLRIIERAGELGLVVLIHAGADIGFPGVDRCGPDKLLRMIRQVGPVKLVLAHMGGWRQWDQARELLVDTPVYLDTAFSTGSFEALEDGHHGPEDRWLLGEEQFVTMVRAFGADRVLFGSDSPWSDQRKDIEWICALPLTQGEKEAILGGNAQRLLGLSG